MDTSPQLTAIEKFYAAFGSEDLSLLAGIVTDDFRIEIPRMENLPLQPEYRGTAGFRQLLKDREPAIRYTLFEVEHRLVQGAIAVVLGRTEGLATQMGKSFAHRWVHVFDFVDGRISTFKEYIDSSSVCGAFCS